MSTIPDPRSRTLSPAEGIMSPSQHPDLSAEIATLSNKLINAINHQANLADSLNEARHELETSRERIRQLELSAENHETQLANVILVERKKGQANIAEEVKKRNIAEKAKADMEKELENLTTALFEEANKVRLVNIIITLC
jgi:chromosome segregation ATPase